MSNAIWAEIAARVNSHDYMAGVERTVDRVAATGEVFTPTELVIEMLRTQDPAVYGPGKTVIDPACGDGQFLVTAKWAKVLIHGMSEETAVADLYGVDIMRDNVDLCRRRLGGGTIILGNTLKPKMRLPEQTDIEHALMLRLFTKGSTKQEPLPLAA